VKTQEVTVKSIDKDQTYQQALAILESIPAGMKYKEEIDRVAFLRQIIGWLGFDRLSSKVMRLAGTNGKGSTGKMVTNFLVASGLTVAGFNSPHLFEIREEITWNGDAIAEADFAQAFFDLLAVLDNHGVNLLTEISSFEASFLTAMAFYIRQNPDYLVLEAGLGGELDATNAIPRSDYTILTRIGMDHMRILGDNLTTIAQTKVRMVREGETIISYASQRPEVDEVVTEIAQERGNRVFSVTMVELNQVAESGTKRTVAVTVGGQEIKDIHLGLQGSYQLGNLQTAIATWQVLSQIDGVSQIPLAALKSGIATAHMPGRFEYLQEEPRPVIVDGAHNVDGINALIETVQGSFANRRKVLIVGFLADKDTLTCVQDLCALNDTTFIVTTPDNQDRQLAAEDLYQEFLKFTDAKRVLTIVNPAQATQYALEHFDQENDVILATGSFYLVKEVIKAVHNQ
jgi:dihydrofolate synthase / folylpolyglutamate synthase